MKKSFSKAIKRIAYPITIVKDDNYYVVYIPDFDANTQGENVADAMAMARDAIEMLCRYDQDNGKPIPKPSNINDIAVDGDTILTVVEVSV